MPGTVYKHSMETLKLLSLVGFVQTRSLRVLHIVALNSNDIITIMSQKLLQCFLGRNVALDLPNTYPVWKYITDRLYFTLSHVVRIRRILLLF